jgi:predicted RNA-binding protein with PIN domain
MHYLIDGYNLLHHVGRLPSKRAANLELARVHLLQLLHSRFSSEAAQVTVVFDAQRAPPNVPKQDSYLGISVHFTRYEEADDLIETIIRKVATPLQLTVVSNDRRIKEAARRRNCPVVECVEFWEMLLHKPKAQPAPAAASESERPVQSREEVDEWVREFGDLEDDPGYRELFGDEMMEE